MGQGHLRLRGRRAGLLRQALLRPLARGGRGHGRHPAQSQPPQSRQGRPLRRAQHEAHHRAHARLGLLAGGRDGARPGVPGRVVHGGRDRLLDHHRDAGLRPGHALLRSLRGARALMDPKIIEKHLRQTKVVRAPKRALSTFGATRISYHLVSPVEDLKDKTRLREGEVVSERPKILTADAFAERFQGFGDDAREFAQWLTSSYRELLRALEYNFRNQGFKTRVLSESTAAVLDRMTSELDEREAGSDAVILCPDGAWSLALMKFTLDESARSFPTHVRDLERRGLFDAPRKEQARRRREIEAMFSTAASDRGVIEALSRKLREYGLFEEYEDRYLSLF